MPTIVIGDNTRIICPRMLTESVYISSSTLLAASSHILDLVTSASTIIFASYRRELSGEIDEEISLKVAKLVAKLVTNPQRILYLSSDSVFSGLRGFYCVNDNPDPISEYGKVKALQEEVFRDSVILRFTVLGPSFSSRPLISEIVKSKRSIVGFPHAYFSPVSTWSINEVLKQHVLGNIHSGIHHLSSQRVSKFDVFNDLFGRLDSSPHIEVQSSVFSDHSLIASPGLDRPLDAELDLALITDFESYGNHVSKN